MAEDLQRETEEMTLGMMMVDKAVIPKIHGIIKTAAAFRTTDHQLIYQAIIECYEQHGIAEPVTVAKQLEKEDNLNRAGGATYIYDLQAQIVETESAEQYATEIRGNFKRRETSAVGNTIIANVKDPNNPLPDILDEATQQLLTISQDTVDNKTASEPLNLGLKNTLQILEDRGKGESPAGLRTGFDSLDSITNGLQPGNFVIIGARPSMGKSALVTNIAQNIANLYQQSSLIFSLEMSKIEIHTRILASESAIPHRIVNRGQFDSQQFEQYTSAANRLMTREPQIIINDNRSLDISGLRIEARRIKAERGGLALIVVDYIQLMRPKTPHAVREREVAEVSRELKSLAWELDIPIIACSQLNRAAETKPDQKPSLHQLRESGALEQDADIVALLHRQPPTVDDTPTADPHPAELLIRKNRNGPTRDIELWFQPEIMKFDDLTESEEDNAGFV